MAPGVSSALSPSPSSPSSSSISSATSVKTGIHQSETTAAPSSIDTPQTIKNEEGRQGTTASARTLTSFAESKSPSRIPNGVTKASSSAALKKDIGEDDDQLRPLAASTKIREGSSESTTTAVVRPKAPPPALPARPISASEQLLQDIQNTLAQNASPSRTRQSLSLDKIANPATAITTSTSSLKVANQVSSFHAPPPPLPPRRFGNRWRGDHFLEIQEFSPIFEEPLILQNR